MSAQHWTPLPAVQPPYDAWRQAPLLRLSFCSSPETVVGSLGRAPSGRLIVAPHMVGVQHPHLPHKHPLPGTTLWKREAEASCMPICR